VDGSDPYPFSLDETSHTFNLTTDGSNPWTLILPSWLTSDVSGRTGSGTFKLTVKDTSTSHSLSEIRIESYFADDFTIDASFVRNPKISCTAGTYFEDCEGNEGYYFGTETTGYISFTDNYGATYVDASVYVVAGGGGGGGNQSGQQQSGGGGGGGGLIILNTPIYFSTNIGISVGAGGNREDPGGSTPSQNGGNSEFTSQQVEVVAFGGGAGGGRNSGMDGENGGSGGGAGALYLSDTNYDGDGGDASAGSVNVISGSTTASFYANIGGTSLSFCDDDYQTTKCLGAGGGGAGAAGVRRITNDDTGGAGIGILAKVMGCSNTMLSAGGPSRTVGGYGYNGPGCGGWSAFDFNPEPPVPGTSENARNGIAGLVSIKWKKIT